MDRKTLKALSWNQMIDKIWWLLLISFIIYVIVYAATSILAFVITIPLAIFPAIAMIMEEYELFEILYVLTVTASSMLSSMLSMFVTGPFLISNATIHLNIANGGGKPNVADAFAGFKHYWRSVGLAFYTMIFTLLWTMLFFVPGIVKSYSYAMAPFILIDNPGMKALDAITASRRMMNGHKWELFVLDLSFIGWGLLTIVTLGIAGIWYVPYHTTAYANFYKKLKGELI